MSTIHLGCLASCTAAICIHVFFAAVLYSILLQLHFYLQLCCAADSDASVRSIVYTQLQLEVTFGLLANDNIAMHFCSDSVTAILWLLAIMMGEARHCTRPHILYLAGACLARLCNGELLIACSPDGKTGNMKLYTQFPDAPGLMDTCLQHIYQVIAATTLCCIPQLVRNMVRRQA